MAIDYRQPNYAVIYEERAQRLEKTRNDPELLANIKQHYRMNPWDFVTDWGTTFEPRNIEVGLIPNIPLILWPRQIEFMQWLITRWQLQERGLLEKSRDCGATWLTVGFAVSMWSLVDGFTIGFGSRKEELVDRRGDHKSIFEKIRFFIDHLPHEFKPVGFTERVHCSHMKIINPENGASITGEAGDEIGRGGRCSIYFVDEAAFIEHQSRVDAALSQNTNCQIDISTPNGNGNSFYNKRQKFNNTDQLFIFDWRDDPRKDDVWYQKQLAEQDDATVAQEIDRDYNASDEDAFIPSKWVTAAIGAHSKLGFVASGIRVTGFDPADIGDAKAIVHRHGSIIEEATQITHGDITQAIPWAMHQAQAFRADVFIYDGDGMGVPSMRLALQHISEERMKIKPYRGSGAVVKPHGKYGSDGTNGLDLRKNRDIFLNFRAQSWTNLRDRFKATYDAVQRHEQGLATNVDFDALISIDSGCAHLQELAAELSRPRRIFTGNGKIKVEAKQDMRKRGVDSPNLADALVMAFTAKRPLEGQRSIRLGRVNHRMNDPGVGY